MPTEFNLKELLMGDATRLRYVIRYSTCQRLHNENVAEHSYYVALYSMLVADWVNESGQSIKVSNHDFWVLMRRALFHDLEEAVTGDVPRGFKKSATDIDRILHDGGMHAFETMMTKIVGRCMANVYTDNWVFAKSPTICGRIIMFCDYLAVLSYMCGELLNNVTMQDNWQIMSDYSSEFMVSDFDFIRPLVDQAEAILNDGFKKWRVE